MSDQQGEVSEVSGLGQDSEPNVGGTAPDAAATDQVAQGEPRNYSGDKPEEEDSLRSGEAGQDSDDNLR